MKPNILRKQWADYQQGLLTKHDIFGTIVDSVTLERFAKTLDDMPVEMLKEFCDYVGLDQDSSAMGVSTLRLEACD